MFVCLLYIYICICMCMCVCVCMCVFMCVLGPPAVTDAGHTNPFPKTAQRLSVRTWMGTHRSIYNYSRRHIISSPHPTGRYIIYLPDIYSRICGYMCVHVCKCAYMCVCVCIRVACVYMCVCVCIYICVCA